MHFIGLALYAEGPTDYHFLRPLLLRLCSDICLTDASAPVEFSEEVIALNHAAAVDDRPRPYRIVDAAKQAKGAWRIVFVHTDGAGDPTRARLSLAQPAIDLFHQECATDGVGVAVIPVRETEAWALVDGDASGRSLEPTWMTNNSAFQRQAVSSPCPTPSSGWLTRSSQPSPRPPGVARVHRPCSAPWAIPSRSTSYAN